METDTVPHEGLMWPILSLQLLKEDCDKDAVLKTLSWCKEETGITHLEGNVEVSSSDDKFIKNEKDELDQKESNLCLEESSYVKERIIFKKALVESNDRNIDNDVMEPCTFKKETIDVNEAAEEVNYGHNSPVKSEFITQEELEIKDEEDNKDMGKSEHLRKPENQLMLHQCPECSYRSANKSNLKKHSIKHKKPEEVDWYTCQECPYRSFRKRNFNAHVKIHNSNSSILKCSKCFYETRKPAYLKRHQIRHQEENEKGWHRCLECSYKTPYNHHLQKHTLSHKPREKLNKKSHKPRKKLMLHQCPECSYSTTCISYLKSHSVVHKKPEINWYNCQECSYGTLQKRNLKSHVQVHNSNRLILKCSKCSYETSTPSSLKTHEIRHQEDDGKGWHKCPECSYKTPFNYHLHKHISLHKSKRELNKKSPKPENQLILHQCPECSYSTIYEAYFKSHSIKHKKPEEINWYNCHECPYRSSLKQNLKTHVQIHNTNKLLLKCSSCSYETWRQAALNRHQIQHQGENEDGWHRCLECPYRALYKLRLQKHVLSHKSKEKLNKNSEKPGTKLMLHQCPECPYITTSKFCFKSHLNKHKKPEEVDWYVCQECSYRTFRKGSLKTHMKIHNNIIATN